MMRNDNEVYDEYIFIYPKAKIALLKNKRKNQVLEQTITDLISAFIRD